MFQARAIELRNALLRNLRKVEYALRYMDKWKHLVDDMIEILKSMVIFGCAYVIVGRLFGRKAAVLVVAVARGLMLLREYGEAERDEQLKLAGFEDIFLVVEK